MQSVTAILNRHPQRPKAFRPHRIENQSVGSDLQTCETALKQIDASGHRGDVNTFGGGAALDVGHIRHQHLLEVTHRPFAVSPGQHPGMHDTGQCRAVRGALEVVVHRRRYLLGGESVAHSGEQLTQLVSGQQVEEHEHIGLFGGLVPVDAVVVGFQDPVESRNVAVAFAQTLPVEFLQIAVTLELADDCDIRIRSCATCRVERHVHQPADLIPPLQFATADTE